MTTTTLPARAISAKLAAALLWAALTLAIGYFTPWLLGLVGVRYIEAGTAMFVLGSVWWMYGGKVQRWLRR